MKLARNVEGYIREGKKYTMDNYSGVMMIMITVVYRPLHVHRIANFNCQSKKQSTIRGAQCAGKLKNKRENSLVGTWKKLHDLVSTEEDGRVAWRED